jgi:hypothetical protein
MNERIKLYLDEDTISRSFINALRARDVDLLTAREAQQMGQPDNIQLEYAISRQRVIFTFNTQDFVRLHHRYLEQGLQHSGIIVSDQLHVGILLRRLLKLMDSKDSEDMRNWQEFLSNWR